MKVSYKKAYIYCKATVFFTVPFIGLVLFIYHRAAVLENYNNIKKFNILINGIILNKILIILIILVILVALVVYLIYTINYLLLSKLVTRYNLILICILDILFLLILLIIVISLVNLFCYGKFKIFHVGFIKISAKFSWVSFLRIIDSIQVKKYTYFSRTDNILFYSRNMYITYSPVKIYSDMYGTDFYFESGYLTVDIANYNELYKFALQRQYIYDLSNYLLNFLNSSGDGRLSDVTPFFEKVIDKELKLYYTE